MWNYEKRLEYPINIKETNPKIAQYIMSQYGGLHCSNLSSMAILQIILHSMAHRQKYGCRTATAR